MKAITTLSLIMFFKLTMVFSQSAPETVNDNYSTPLNTTLNVSGADGLLQNDFDADGDALVVVSFVINGTVYPAGQSVNTLGGNVTINGDGSFTYIPSAGFEGTVPVIAYFITDGISKSVGNLSLTIISEGPPEAQDDYDTADIDTTLDVPAPGVLGNDTFEDETTIAVVSFTINGVTYNPGDTANLAEGNFTMLADGSFVFTPTPGFADDVPPITYTISDGTDFSIATLFLSVQNVEDLIILDEFTSCNQGYSPDGFYQIQYLFSFRNLSTARDYHTSSLIQKIELINDFDAIFGSGCVLLVEDIDVTTTPSEDFVGNPYPLDFDNSIVNPDFLNGTSGILFDPDLFNDIILYPRQFVTISFCLVVDPFCGGRPNPTPSESGIDFESVLEIDSTGGITDISLLLTDFHTTQAFITAVFDIPDNNPEVNADGTYDFINTVSLTNEGSGIANNLNFNMGLGNFLANGLSFNTLAVSQVSGPPVNVNTAYNGDTNTTLLEPNNTLAPGETVVLEIFHILDPVGSTGSNVFAQLDRSQTQGPLDDFDENTPENRSLYTFVTWEDNLGEHLDRYYTSTVADNPEIINQCNCASLSMSFLFTSTGFSEKVITNINEAPNGILEYEEITFQVTFNNSSPIVDLTNLQLEEDLTAICGSLPLSVSEPQIISSSASTNPVLNTDFDGVTDINIFDGTSGLLTAGESITIELTVLFSEDCIGQNTVNFTGTDPVGEVTTSTASVNVNASSDNDDDGITNTIDIDDDNDTILDIEESNGLDPLDDDDGDSIPNYRDPDFSPDDNNDGVVDIFDFDNDGIPNHFDLDSDNDGVFDIYEVRNFVEDTDNDGRTNNPVGNNGLDNTVETNDSSTAAVTYTIPNTDNTTNPDYFDIDSDGDGIVDNIEAQPTENYIPPENTVDGRGVDIAYPQGLVPIDTDGDEIFDYVDINSDNDIRDDFVEGWDFDSDGTPETTASGNDTDNDGLDDAFDNNNTQINPTNAQVPTDFPNVDYDVTEERDWREIMAVVVLISDVSAIEGDDLQFTISLVRFIDNSVPVQSPTPIDLILSTTDGSESAGEFNIAITPFDYVSVSNEDLTIPALTEFVDFSITSLDDNISELDELFTLNASITSDNTVNEEASGTGTIIDDEPLPIITMNDDTVFEGEDLSYFISIDIPSSRPTIINISSANVSATANADYIPISTTFVIDGTTDPLIPNLENSFNITTLVDNINEPDEEVLAVLGNVTSNNVANPNIDHTGTILDIDPNPIVVISSDEVVEGITLVFTLRLLNGEGQPMGNYLPIDFELETRDITTTVNRDYLYFNAFDFIPATESSLTIEIPTINDNLNENKEFMNLSATIISGEVANSSLELLGLGTIIDNDIPNLFSPNNDGQSDVFRIGGLQDFPNFKLIIFDRWGSEIYNYSNNGSTSPQWWDGTKDGDPVIEGVYFYELDYNDGVTKPKTGFIQLIR
jgi:gliding motility-associated-like protein